MFNLNILFYIFSIFLVISFIFSAFLLFLLECELLGLLFIVVYVGAIAIFFLFSIMMLESKLNNLSKNSIKYLPVGFVFGSSLLIFLFHEISISFGNSYISNYYYLNIYQNWYDLIDSTNNAEVYGQVLYSYYVLHFLISGLILLLGRVLILNKFAGIKLRC